MLIKSVVRFSKIFCKFKLLKRPFFYFFFFTTWIVSSHCNYKEAMISVLDCNLRHSPFLLAIGCIGAGIFVCSETYRFGGCQVTSRFTWSGCSIHSFRSWVSLLLVFVYGSCITTLLSLIVKNCAHQCSGKILWQMCLAGSPLEQSFPPSSCPRLSYSVLNLINADESVFS